MDITTERDRMMRLLSEAAAARAMTLPPPHTSDDGDFVEYIGGEQWRIGLTIAADPREGGAHFVARARPFDTKPIMVLQDRDDFDPAALIALAQDYEREPHDPSPPPNPASLVAPRP